MSRSKARRSRARARPAPPRRRAPWIAWIAIAVAIAASATGWWLSRRGAGSPPAIHEASSPADRLSPLDAYSLGLQPWRSIFFGIADIALWITAISLLVASV